MQVVVIVNRRAPIVTHMVWYRVGAADEPLGKSGIAHFLEHGRNTGIRNTEVLPAPDTADYFAGRREMA